MSKLEKSINCDSRQKLEVSSPIQLEQAAVCRFLDEFWFSNASFPPGVKIVIEGDIGDTDLLHRLFKEAITRADYEAGSIIMTTAAGTSLTLSADDLSNKLKLWQDQRSTDGNGGVRKVEESKHKEKNEAQTDTDISGSFSAELAAFRRSAKERITDRLRELAGKLVEESAVDEIQRAAKNFNLRLRLLNADPEGRQPAIRTLSFENNTVILETIEKEQRKLPFKTWPKLDIFEPANGRGINLGIEDRTRGGETRIGQLSEKEHRNLGRKAAQKRWGQAK